MIEGRSNGELMLMLEILELKDDYMMDTSKAMYEL